MEEKGLLEIMDIKNKVINDMHERNEEMKQRLIKLCEEVDSEEYSVSYEYLGYSKSFGICIHKWTLDENSCPECDITSWIHLDMDTEFNQEKYAECLEMLTAIIKGTPLPEQRDPSS